MQLINLRKNPQAIPQIAQWHFDEWHALFPERTLADFAAELAESLQSDDIPVILEDAGVLPSLVRPSHIEQLCSWGLTISSPTRIFNDFGYIPQTWLLLDEQQNVCGTGSLLLRDMKTNHQLSPWLAR
ncbi:hypothetical protein [Rheinheimera riviphila]|uniref:hypothetical protein n=1 Tax=Rheinheimera riviphila TaxID=1834037 RepID=UPI00197E4A1D|nr:hypothetical protein [Rheinheimera riviphila]